VRLRCGAFFLCFFVATSATAFAQNIPSSVLPGREREIFTPPSEPLSRPASPLLQIPDRMVPAQAAGTHLRLDSVSIEGSTVYSKEQLSSLYAGLVGKDVTAADIYALADRIGAQYGRDGYLVARAVVVPQAVNPRAAAIKLQIVEGYIERVEWPDAAKRYRDLSSDCVAQMTAERPARIKTIERCLLLASDLPGIKFSSSIRAGEHDDGGAVLVVSVVETPFSATAGVDNRGAIGRGPWEYTGSITANNRLHLDEALNVTYAGSLTTSELQYFAGDYRQVLTPGGLFFDINGSYSFGRPGLASLQALDFKSNAATLEASLTYPMIRSREQNLLVSAVGFVENARSYALGAPFSDDRLRGFRARAAYDQVDTWLGPVGQLQAITTFSQGIDGLGSTHNGSALASVGNGRVDFSKIEFTINRVQALVGHFSLFAALDAQYAGSALLAAEQCTYGGRFFGRAFDADTLTGDRCWTALGELRYDIAFPNNPLSQTQLYGFADHGDLYRVAPSAATANHVDGASVGAGLRLAYTDLLTADLQAAHSIGALRSGWRGYFIFTVHY
jgi:hemolysin activation/secretion protein